MRTLVTILICCLVNLLPAQQVSVSNITCTNANYGDATCMAVHFDVQLKQTYNELLKAGDSAGFYILELRLKDGQGNWVSPSKGFGSCTDSSGRLKVTLNMPLNYESKIYAGQTIMLPFAAIGLEEGLVKLQPVVSVVDGWNQKRANDATGVMLDCIIPAKLHLNFSVREIQVEALNSKSQSWDYKLPDADNDKPEVCWSLLEANKKLCTSPFKANSLLYRDEEGKDDFVFTISRGDIFTIQVQDYDLNSYSDKIGSMKIDMNDMEKFSGSSFTSKFGRVVKLEFIVTIL
ncbi:MAG: hypothetical protein U0T75_06750 [Chitinophagales bacterium]